MSIDQSYKELALAIDNYWRCERRIDQSYAALDLAIDNFTAERKKLREESIKWWAEIIKSFDDLEKDIEGGVE